MWLIGAVFTPQNYDGDFALKENSTDAGKVFRKIYKMLAN